MASQVFRWFSAARRVVTATLVVLSFTAAAGAAEPGDRDAARALFREGSTLVRAGELERAIQSFERSLELYPHAATYYNLGLAEQRRGQPAAAASYLRRALERSAADPTELPAESRRAAEERLAAIERTLAAEPAPSVPAVPASGPAGSSTPPAQASASDTSASGPSPAAAAVAPAPHLPAAAPPAAAPPAVAPVVSAPTGPAQRRTEPSSSTRSPLLFPALGVAAAGAISTIVFGSLALAQQAELDRLCPDPARCPAGTGQEADELATLAIAADVSLAVALAGTGLSVYAWFTPRESAPKAARFGFSGRF